MRDPNPASPFARRVPAPKRPPAWALAALLLAATSAGAQMRGLGPDFQVNTDTTYRSGRPDVAMDAVGNFVVVWRSLGSQGTDTSSYSVQGQRFAADGTPLGGQFQINSYTADRQWEPRIAMDPPGNFVVVWESRGSSGGDTSSYSVLAQRFAADGTPLGSEFQVNSYTTGGQRSPAVASDALGNFVVVWNSLGSYGTDTDSYSVQGRRFAADGTPLGTEFQVNQYTTSIQFVTALALDPSNNFVVVWASDGSYGTDTSILSIQAQRFDPDGAPLGSQFQVNSYTTWIQSHPDVAADSQGNFVVVWESNGSYGTDTSVFSIQGQRFAADGTPLGGQFQVNSLWTHKQYKSAIFVRPQGDFVVAWQSWLSWGTDRNPYSIQAQLFEPDGSPRGGQLQVNTFTLGTETYPQLAWRPSGQLVAVWDRNALPVADDVQARRFELPFFYDGFESGDTSGWSATMP